MIFLYVKKLFKNQNLVIHIWIFNDINPAFLYGTIDNEEKMFIILKPKQIFYLYIIIILIIMHIIYQMVRSMTTENMIIPTIKSFNVQYIYYKPSQLYYFIKTLS